MNELRAVVEAAKRARQKGESALLATVVRVCGSAYRRPGARMLLTPDGWQAGGISGGCLESDVLRKAWWRTRNGEPVIVTYDSSVPLEDADLAEELSHGFGLGCNGVVEVLLERIEPVDNPACPVAFVRDCLRRRRTGVLATVIAAEPNANGVGIGQRMLLSTDDAGAAQSSVTTITDPDLSERLQEECRISIATGESRSVRLDLSEGASVDVFVEAVHPPLPLVICGAGHDAIPLARLASELGWAVTVVEPRPGITPRPDRFPDADTVIACAPENLPAAISIDARTAAVVMSHNLALDSGLIGALLPTAARYIGVLGPRRRTEQMLEGLRAEGLPMPDLERLHGPVGIDIGADTPAAIALSILAEIQAVFTGRSGGLLRDRPLPIHGGAAGASAPPREEHFAILSGRRGEAIVCGLMTDDRRTVPA